MLVGEISIAMVAMLRTVRQWSSKYVRILFNTVQLVNYLYLEYVINK